MSYDTENFAKRYICKILYTNQVSWRPMYDLVLFTKTILFEGLINVDKYSVSYESICISKIGASVLQERTERPFFKTRQRHMLLDCFVGHYISASLSTYSISGLSTCDFQFLWSTTFRLYQKCLLFQYPISPLFQNMEALFYRKRSEFSLLEK